MMFNNSINKTVILLMIITITIIILLPSLSSAAYPTLRVGSRGEAVSRLQQGLKDSGYFNHPNITGYYGQITRNAVINYQRVKGLTVDGIAGIQTHRSLFDNNAGVAQSSGAQTLRLGMRGPNVVRLQDALRNQGLFQSNSTGYFGTITQKSVMDYQRKMNLKVDGIAGPHTLGVLYSSATPNRSGAATSNISEGDLLWLARIIQAESSGEPYLGKVAVGNVVLNRVKSNSFPNSIYNVIFEYYKGIPQFSPVHDGSIYNSPSTASFRAAKDAANGQRPVGNALYFFNPSKAAGTWIVNNRTYHSRIGNHTFYN